MVSDTTTGEVLTGGKGAKGRRSVLNVTQPRRKAKLQLAQSTAPSPAPYHRCPRMYYCQPRDIASELRVSEREGKRDDARATRKTEVFRMCNSNELS